MENISKTKGSIRILLFEECRQQAASDLRQKNVSGKMKRKTHGKQKNVDVNTKEVAAQDKTKPLEKARD